MHWMGERIKCFLSTDGSKLIICFIMKLIKVFYIYFLLEWIDQIT